MSDNRRVAGDTKDGGEVMNTAVHQSASYLNELAKAHHRGRGDTWTAARDRAARAAGLERSYAKRIWDRWQTMSDVSGEAYLKLRTAYEALCDRNDEAAAGYRAERLELRAIRHADHQERARKGAGADHARD